MQKYAERQTENSFEIDNELKSITKRIRMNTKRAKRDCERAVRTTISLPPGLFTAAEERKRSLHYGTLSDYFQALVRHDALPGLDRADKEVMCA